MADTPQNTQKIPAKKSSLKKRLKICLKFFLWFTGILIVLLTLLISCRDLLIAAAIRNVVPKIIGSEVILKDFSTTLNGSLYIRDLQICNQPGFSQPHLLKYESVYMKLDVSTLFSRMPVIEVVEVRGLTINYEINKDGISNITMMQEKIDDFFGVPKEKAETTDKASPEPEKEETSLLIRRLTFTGTKLQSGSLVVPLPSLTLENLGGKNSIRSTLRENFDMLAASVQTTGKTVTNGMSIFQNPGKKLIQFGSEAGKNIKNAFEQAFKHKK